MTKKRWFLWLSRMRGSPSSIHSLTMKVAWFQLMVPVIWSSYETSYGLNSDLLLPDKIYGGSMTGLHPNAQQQLKTFSRRSFVGRSLTGGLRSGPRRVPTSTHWTSTSGRHLKNKFTPSSQNLLMPLSVAWKTLQQLLTQMLSGDLQATYWNGQGCARVSEEAISYTYFRRLLGELGAS